MTPEDSTVQLAAPLATHLFNVSQESPAEWPVVKCTCGWKSGAHSSRKILWAEADRHYAESIRR